MSNKCFASMLLLLALLNESNSSSETAEERIQSVIFENYSKSVRPFSAAQASSRAPTVVDVSVYIRSVSVVDELRMEFTADMLLRQYWNDPRLAFAEQNVQEKLSFLQLGQDNPIPQVWVPDTFFPTMRKGDPINIAVPNRLTRIYASGDIYHSVRYIATFACDMDFRMFPFDSQNCVVTIGTFSSTTAALVLQWKVNSSILVEAGLKLPKFLLEGYTTVDCFNIQISGNFSCLKFQLKLQRQIQFHVIETFMPTTLLVVASWLSFWIDPAAAPARISLACVLMLSTVTLGTSVKSSLPPVSYIKALDIWFGTCITFIFLTLLEYGLVTYFYRRQLQLSADAANAAREKAGAPFSNQPNPAKPFRARRRVQQLLLGSTEPPKKIAWSIEDGSKSSHAPQENNSPEKLKPHLIADFAARIAFPTSFFLFVILFVTELRFLPSRYA